MTNAVRASDERRDTPTPEEAARLLAENESLRSECFALQREAQRLQSINRRLDGSLRVVQAERDRLKAWTDAVEKSIAWRLIQAIRGLVGKRW